VVQSYATASAAMPNYEYNLPKTKITTKFDIYKYQKTGMMRLNVESMAKNIGLQLNSDTAIAAAARLNLDKLEAQLSK
jgi:hypothetical protein